MFVPMKVAERARFGTRLLRYLKDPSVPVGRKLLGLVTALYVVWPLDVLPDMIPIIGWLDDVGILGLGAWWVVREVNRHSAKKPANASARTSTVDAVRDGP
jgi:uncharacterized membrane protein YkvA (DUF1232 family)